MHTFKYPIRIDNQGYYIEKTFDGSPAIYKAIHFSHKGHISDDPTESVQKYITHEPGVVIIVARKTDDSIETMKENLSIQPMPDGTG